MGEVIEVTPENATELKAALHSLKEHRLMLYERLRRYPLIIEFAGYRFVADTEAEIDSLTETLASKLTAARCT